MLPKGLFALGGKLILSDPPSCALLFTCHLTVSPSPTTAGLGVTVTFPLASTSISTVTVAIFDILCGFTTIQFVQAERCASAAAGSGSDVGADAGGSRLQAVVRQGFARPVLFLFGHADTDTTLLGNILNET